ncbi:hypothetical protein ABPG74_013928 [Tetrahymena malaccensis]
MNGSQRYDYLGPTNIFLRNKEYERHQKKLEEIKGIKAKGTYYNKQHIEGIRVYNNIKVNNNKFKDKIKNDELQINNNKILKKIIDISRHDNGLSKTHFSQLSPRRANIEEVDKIIRENQILSNKINNVDSQLNNRKFASHYQLLYECKKRIQRFEVIDYEKNQVKLKAYDLANSTFNGGLTQAHSRLSQRKQSLNLNSNGNQDEIFENNDHYTQQDQNNSLGDTQNYHQKSQISNYKQIQITTSQNSPRENQFDSARAKSCERDRISGQRKNQYFQGQNQGYYAKDNQKENNENQTQNTKGQRLIGTSEQARYRSVSRGRGASTRSSYEPSKNPSDSQLPSHRYFRNFKRANNPERQSLNLTSNSIGYQKLNASDEQNLNKTGESNYKNSSNKSGVSSRQTNEGDFYNEEGYGYGQEEENSAYYKKVPQKLNQNYIQKNDDKQVEDKKQSVETNKITQQEKQNKIHQIKNNSRVYSAKGTQKDKLRSTTPNKNIINNSQNQGIQQSQYKEEQCSSKNTPRGLVQIDQVDRSSIQSRQNDKNNKRQFSQHSDQVQGDNTKKMNHSQQQSKVKQESNYTKESFDIEENITSQKDSKEDLNEEYNYEDEDFVQQEESYQLDDDTKKKFLNNSKNFYKDKKKEQYQIAEQEEYEEDFESQLINKSSNLQNKNQSSNSQKIKVSNNQNNSKNQHKKESDQNKFDDLESSKINSSHNASEIKTDKSKLISSQLKSDIKNQQNQEKKQGIQKNSNNKISKQDQEDNVNKYEEENFELDE